MPALLAENPMHSSPPFSHFNVHQASHDPSPPTSPINSRTSSIFTPADEDRPPDLACPLRFGDIPASSFPAGAHGFMHSPAAMQLLGSSVVPADSGYSPKGEVKLLNRSQSKLSKRSASPIRGNGREFEVAAGEGIPVTISRQNDAPCCGGPAGFCSSPNCMMGSPQLPEALLTFQKFLPSNNVADDEEYDEEIWSGTDMWPALDIYSCDEFRMYEFKVRKCVRGRSHDWTECPFAHPGEKARRRDPRRYRYSGTACPDFRKGSCRRGEACEYSHGVFECWLHPTRYRTQPCKDGKGCRRRVCFFAHTPEQLRVVPAEAESPPTTPGSGSSSGGSSARSSLLKAAALSGGAYDGSPLRRALVGTLDGTVALELFLDDASSKNAAAACHHHHNHLWIGMGTSPSSTLGGLSAGATSPPPMSSPVLSPASPLVTSVSSWAGMPAHRRHLDRLRSIPTISIPGTDDTSDSSPSQGSLAELMSTLQSLQFSPSATAIQSCRTQSTSSSSWSLLSQIQQASSQSAPNTPKTRYAHQMSMMQINPTERASSSYLMKPIAVTATSAVAAASLVPAPSGDIPGPESDVVPDLEWVNELVQ
eukprot:c5158_g1_i1 orf=417-2192(-)